MNKRPTLIQAMEDYLETYPLQFHIPSHSGRFLNKEFESFLMKHGVKKIDGCRRAQQNVEGLEFPGWRLGDLGDIYHTPFNSQMTLYLQNGGSSGNHVLSLCLAEKKVLIQTNSHASIYSGLQLAGATIIPIQPEYNAEYDIYLPLSAAQIQEALDNDPEIGAVFLTSPNYEGLVANYQEIRKVCKDIPLFVDEAHGAHMYFSKAMPQGAICGGADASVVSLHKSLGALNSAALINISKFSRIHPQKIKHAHHLMNTTSTSPLMMADVETSVSLFNKQGETIIGKAIELSNKLKASLSRMPQVVMADFSKDFAVDPTKTVFRIKGLSGYKLHDLLEETKRINVEKATQNCIVVTCNVSILEEEVDYLIKAIQEIAIEYGQLEQPDDSFTQYDEPIYKKMLIKRKVLMDLRKVLTADFEVLKASQCLGRISSETKVMCPPGFPILVSGEVILQEHIDLLGDAEIKVIIEKQ